MATRLNNLESQISEYAGVSQAFQLQKDLSAVVGICRHITGRARTVDNQMSSGADGTVLVSLHTLPRKTLTNSLNTCLLRKV